MMKNPMFRELEESDDGLPVHRNFQCPEYNDCLTDAAFHDLDLHCCDCSLKDEKRSIFITESEIASILMKTFRRDFKKR